MPGLPDVGVYREALVRITLHGPFVLRTADRAAFA
jgi:hypothetical protein